VAYNVAQIEWRADTNSPSRVATNCIHFVKASYDMVTHAPQAIAVETEQRRSRGNNRRRDSSKENAEATES
jgi:hypothetical protein